MSLRRTLLGFLCAVVLLPSVAAAQHSWDIQGKVGVGIPLGDLADTNDPGFSAALGLTRWLAPRYGLHFGAAGNFLPGAELFPGVKAPDLDLWHYNGGIEFDLISPTESKWRLHAVAGVGATTAQVDGGDSSTDFTFNAGMSPEYRISDNFNLLADVDFYAIFADETQYVLPILGGFRYFFSE